MNLIKTCTPLFKWLFTVCVLVQITDSQPLAVGSNRQGESTDLNDRSLHNSINLNNADKSNIASNFNSTIPNSSTLLQRDGGASIRDQIIPAAAAVRKPKHSDMNGGGDEEDELTDDEEEKPIDGEEEDEEEDAETEADEDEEEDFAEEKSIDEEGRDVTGDEKNHPIRKSDPKDEFDEEDADTDNTFVENEDKSVNNNKMGNAGMDTDTDGSGDGDDEEDEDKSYTDDDENDQDNSFNRVTGHPNVASSNLPSEIVPKPALPPKVIEQPKVDHSHTGSSETDLNNNNNGKGSAEDGEDEDETEDDKEDKEEDDQDKSGVTDIKKVSPPEDDDTGRNNQIPSQSRPDTGITHNRPTHSDRPSHSPTPNQPDDEKDHSITMFGKHNFTNTVSLFSQPAILAAIIGSAVIGLLISILLVMVIIYRMRTKEEDCYETPKPPLHNVYGRANHKDRYP